MDGGDFLRDGRSILQNALLLTGVNLLLRGVSMLFQIYLSGQIGAGGIGLLQLILTVGSFAMTVGLAGLRTVRLLASRFTYWFTLVMNVLGLALGVMMLAQPWVSLLSLEYLVSFYLMLLGVDCIILACSRLGSRG